MISLLQQWLLPWQFLVLVVLSSPFLLVQAFKAYVLYIKPRVHYLRDLPGEERTTKWIIGSNDGLLMRDPGQQTSEWQKEYGPVYTYWDFLGSVKLGLADMRGIAHVLMNSQYGYQKSPGIRFFLAKVVGPGLAFAEGDQHKAQRRIIQPSFSVPHLKEQFPVLLRCSDKIVLRWKEIIGAKRSERFPMVLTPSGEEKPLEELARREKEGEGVIIDVYSWMKAVALDAIGSAGFGFEFGNLDGAKTTLGTALEQGSASRASKRPNAKLLTVQAFIMTFPSVLFRLPFKHLRQTEASQKTAKAECWKIFSEKKKAIMNSQEEDAIDAPKKRRDLIDLLIRANMEMEEKKRLNEEEVMSQMTTFVFAGADTSSIGLSSALYRLSQNPQIQDKLREEIRQAIEDVKSSGGDRLGFEEIESLRYLDSIIRETLRLDSPVSAINRMATRDDRIPLSKPITLRSGKEVDYVDIKKGQQILIPVLSIHKDKDIWGEDAEEFRPDRWLDGVPEALAANKGASVYSYLLTFAGGPRACIGYRFAILEMKSILARLITEFKFDDTGIAIEGVDAIVVKPTVKGAIDTHPMLPLRVSLI